jgi:hypothetical protein
MDSFAHYSEENSYSRETRLKELKTSWRQSYQCSVELKSLPANYDRTQHNPVWIFVISQTYFSMVYAWT